MSSLWRAITRPVPWHGGAIGSGGMPFFAQAFDPIARFWEFVSDPTVAYVLLVAGLAAILFELANPGQVLPGAVGVGLAILALYVLGTLPVNFTGLALIFIAFVLFAAELLAPGFGAFGVSGIISLLLGSLILVRSPNPLAAVSPFAVGFVVVATSAFVVFVIRTINRLHRRPVATGREGLIGAVGEARTDLKPTGYVFVQGELWQAISLLEPVAANQRVQVLSLDGYRLVVFPVDDLA